MSAFVSDNHNIIFALRCIKGQVVGPNTRGSCTDVLLQIYIVLRALNWPHIIHMHCYYTLLPAEMGEFFIPSMYIRNKGGPMTDP